MAFTEAEKANIRFYMGWSGRFFNDFDTRLEQAISAIETRPETETIVRNKLTELDQLETELTGARTRLKAWKVGSILLPRTMEIAVLRSEGRRKVSSMAATLGAEVRQDVFSATVFRSFQTHRGLVRGARSNVLRQG